MQSLNVECAWEIVHNERSLQPSIKIWWWSIDISGHRYYSWGYRDCVQRWFEGVDKYFGIWEVGLWPYSTATICSLHWGVLRYFKAEFFFWKSSFQSSHCSGKERSWIRNSQLGKMTSRMIYQRYHIWVHHVKMKLTDIIYIIIYNIIYTHTNIYYT